MRSERRFVNTEGFNGIKSSFLSCEKDAEAIIRKLFVDSKPYSEELKRLLLINTKDCLDNRTNTAYQARVKNTSVADLMDEQYIRLQPKIKMEENEEVKSYLIFSFDNFVPNDSNSYYRDSFVEIDIICHTDYWDLGNYRQRPLKIAGLIDGILNETKLSGIGLLQFVGASQMVLNENLSGYCLIYRAVHSDDDTIPVEED